MPNDDSTPQMFENRNGLSSVTTVSSHADRLALEPDVRPRPAGCRATAGRAGRWPSRLEQLQVAAREALEETARSRLPTRSAGRPLQRARPAPACCRVDQLVAVAEREVVVGVDVQPPEQLFLPRRQRLGADRLDVGERQQAEHLQPLFDADQLRRTAGRSPDPRCRAGTRPATSRRWLAMRNSTIVRAPRPSARAASNMSLRHPRRSRRRGPRRATCRRRGAAAPAPAAPAASQIGEQRREALAASAAGVASRSRFRIVSSVCSSTVYLW